MSLPPKLSRRMVLEARQTAPDGAGGLTTTWTALGTLWVEVRPGTGREERDVEIKRATVPCRIVMRAAAPGSPRRPVAGNRLVEGSRRFAIEAVTEADAAGRYLICFATEEVPA